MALAGHYRTLGGLIQSPQGIALHLKGFVKDTKATKAILDDLEFPEPGTFMGHRIPRQCLWFGPGPYKFGGRKYYPARPIETLEDLGRQLAEQVRPLLEQQGITLTRPQAYLINKYSKKTDRVSEHQDNEPALGKEPTILSLSIGQTRKFVLRPVRVPGGKRRKPSDARTWILRDGDLVVLAGDIQDWYTHELKRGTQDGVRYNITYRPYVFSQ